MSKRLRRLKDDTDRVLGGLKRANIGGPVNWADLHCVEAVQILTDNGSERTQVTVEEAAPEAIELQDAIKDGLSMYGWNDIEVVTEW